jgi:hypothetical protein
MRILHIWDQAGVACVFAKYQRLQGHDSSVIISSGHDKYGIYDFYKEYIQSVRSKDFIDRCVQEAHLANIIHIHSLYGLVPKFRKKFGRSKKIILHYHGTDLRGSRNKILYTSGITNLYQSLMDRAYLWLRSKSVHKRAQKLADTILVAAPDLLHYLENGIYIPIPIDTDHFKPDRSAKNNTKEALSIDNIRIDMDLALDYLKKHNINLEIEVYDRTKYPVMYRDMPEFLKRYKVYVDIRFVDGKILDHLSTTAEQSLACGLRVLDYQQQYRHGLPIEFDGKNVVSKLFNVYLA